MQAIHENVPGFNILLLAVELVSKYWLFPVEADCADAGMYAMSRRRSYVILLHRDKTILLLHPLQVYAYVTREVALRCTVWNPNDLFWATTEECMAELAPLAASRGVPIDLAKSNWRLLLSRDENQRLESYEQLHGSVINYCFQFGCFCIFGVSV